MYYLCTGLISPLERIAQVITKRFVKEYKKLHDRIDDLHLTAVINMRYHQAYGAKQVSTGDARLGYATICKELKSILCASDVAMRRQYLDENPAWDIRTALE